MVTNCKNIVMQGWLQKESSTLQFFSPWSKGWYTLKHGVEEGQYFLEYFDKESCRGKIWSIDLKEIVQIFHPSNVQRRQSGYTFYVRTDKRDYHFCADTLREFQAWIRTLCLASGFDVTEWDICRTVYSKPKWMRKENLNQSSLTSITSCKTCLDRKPKSVPSKKTLQIISKRERDTKFSGDSAHTHDSIDPTEDGQLLVPESCNDASYVFISINPNHVIHPRIPPEIHDFWYYHPHTQENSPIFSITTKKQDGNMVSKVWKTCKSWVSK